MINAARHKRTLEATFCEVERGVFYAAYLDCGSTLGVDELTTYQTGTSAAVAKAIIERHARDLGYDAVIWRETIKVPLFASLSTTTIDALIGARGSVVHGSRL